jgi:uncharacterized protein (DUF885 family)
MTGAIAQLDGVHFDIAAPLRTIEVVLARGSTSGAAYYTSPSEDLSRPGRTWWPLGGRTDQDGFTTWSELSPVFHEGVPGHHLPVGAAKVAGDRLSRFAKSSFVSGHGEPSPTSWGSAAGWPPGSKPCGGPASTSSGIPPC